MEKYRGHSTTVAEGLRRSINTIAVQTVQAVGIPESYAFATEKLKLSLVPDDMGLSPLGMGGLTHGLNTVEMAAAYACFVNQGIYNEPRTYLRVTKPENDGTETVVLENEGESHVAMKETTAYLVNQMLKTVRERDIKLVGLPALMTTTVVAMEETIKLLHAEVPGVKIIVGGAVLTPEYAKQIGADYYAKDAAESARIAEEVFGQ